MSKKGFTIIEVIVSVSVGAIILTIVYLSFIAGRTIHQKGILNAELAQNGRIALDRLSRDLRQTGEITTILSETKPEPANTEVQFEDGHTDIVQYITYRLDGNELEREVGHYYFETDPLTWVNSTATDAGGNPALYVVDIEQTISANSESVHNRGIRFTLATGGTSSKNYAFSFQEFIDGVQGTEIPDELDKIWFNLGKSAKLINIIPAPNLRVDYEKAVQDLFEDNYFVKNGIFSEGLSLKIRNRLKETLKWEFTPTLCHGDIHPSNVIVDSKDVVHIVDWETATGNRTPHSELAEIYT